MIPHFSPRNGVLHFVPACRILGAKKTSKEGHGMPLLQSLMDTSSHVIFTIDRAGILTHINRRAREQFGLFSRSLHTHPAGRLRPGDMVILATTSLGSDDGNLTAEDLAYIGIDNPKIRQGDMLAAIGVYRDPCVKPVYKYLPDRDASSLQLSAVFQGVPVSVSIGGGEIRVDAVGETYSISYFQCIGQMVVLDGAAKKVKFYQERGYTARKEGLSNLLHGSAFAEKIFGKEIQVTGYHFREFFEGQKFEEHLAHVMAEAACYNDQEYEINGFALVASLLPVMGGDGTVECVIVKARSIEDIKLTIMERNQAIRSAEQRFRDVMAGMENREVFTTLCGNSTLMASATPTTYKLSQMDCPILISGEAGVGKTQVARAILNIQPRRGPFVRVECGSLPPEQLAAELFGAPARLGRPNAVQRADGGTLLLEEVGLLPQAMQIRLLTLIQEKELRLLDGTSVPVNVRLLATTSQPLKQLLQAGTFRADLYYRLSAFCIDLPPLRECRGSIPAIADNLMGRIRQQYGMAEKYLSGEAFDQLISYDWPGNIRELENVLERAVALSDSDIIYPEHICLDRPPAAMTLREQLRKTEQQIIRQTLEQCRGDRHAAMEQLGLSRTVFYEKLKQYGIR